MNICIVSMYYGSNYGQGLCVQKIAEQLAKKNQVHVIHSQKKYSKNKKNLSFHLIKVSKITGLDFINFKKKIGTKFKEINKKNNFDIIYANSFEAAGLIKEKIPFYFHARGTVQGNALNRPKSFFLTEITRKPLIELFTKWDKQCCERAKKIFVPSKQIEKEINQFYSITEKKIQIINDGIEIKQFNPKINGTSLRKQLGLNGNKVILFAGRIVPQKGLQYLIQAMPKILEKIPKTKLVVIGGNSSENFLKKIKNQTKNLELEKHIIFQGFVSQKKMPEHLAIADIVISPSTYEPFGIINLEATAMQKKILLSELIGTKKLFNNYAKFFNPYNPQEIAEKSIKMLKSKKQVNIKKSKKISEKCSWKLIGNQLNTFFKND